MHAPRVELFSPLSLSVVPVPLHPIHLPKHVHIFAVYRNTTESEYAQLVKSTECEVSVLLHGALHVTFDYECTYTRQSLRRRVFPLLQRNSPANSAHSPATINRDL